MTLVCALRLLGLSQLIQAPATAILASRRVLGLGAEIGALSPINGNIVRVLGGAAVGLLLGLGSLVALFPADMASTGLGRALAGMLGAFWTARLAVQLWYGRTWPARVRGWHWFLCTVFAVQGPGYCAAYLLATYLRPSIVP